MPGHHTTRPVAARSRQEQPGDGEDEAADGELVVAEDVRRLLEEREIARVALAREPAQVEVVEEAHHPVGGVVDAEQAARAGVDIRLAPVLLAVDEIHPVAVRHVGGLEGGRLAVDDADRLGVGDRMLRRRPPVQLRVHDPVDLLLVEEHDAADHDGEQRDAEDERRPPVGEDERRAQGRPPAAAAARRAAGGLAWWRRGCGHGRGLQVGGTPRSATCRSAARVRVP